MYDCFNSHRGSHFIVFFTEYSNSATHEKNRIYTLTDVYSIPKENALMMLILPFKSGIGVWKKAVWQKPKKKAKIKLWMLVEFNRNTQKKSLKKWERQLECYKKTHGFSPCLQGVTLFLFLFLNKCSYTWHRILKYLEYLLIILQEKWHWLTSSKKIQYLLLQLRQ